MPLFIPNITAVSILWNLVSFRQTEIYLYNIFSGYVKEVLFVTCVDNCMKEE